MFDNSSSFDSSARHTVHNNGHSVQVKTKVFEVITTKRKEFEIHKTIGYHDVHVQLSSIPKTKTKMHRSQRGFYIKGAFRQNQMHLCIRCSLFIQAIIFFHFFHSLFFTSRFYFHFFSLLSFSPYASQLWQWRRTLSPYMCNVHCKWITCHK